MKAALYRRRGAAADVLRVEEVPTPEPGPGEVRVRMALSAVNPTDWKARKGAGVNPAPVDGFQVPHHDGVGVIDRVGDGVRGRRVGERVWLYLAAFQNRFGTAAEYSVVPEARAVPLPDDASDALGACLGVPAVTAAHCLGNRPDGLSGAAVLVAGGAGAVGHYAVELAKQAGARVAATVSTDEKAALAREAGADLVVNYRDARAVEALRDFQPRFDHIVEVALGANLELDLAVGGPGTTITVYATEADDPVLPTGRLMSLNASIHYVLLYGVPPAELDQSIAWVRRAVVAHALSPLPIHRFPLADAARAHDAVEQHAVGKVVLAL